MTRPVQHSAKSVEHYGPPGIGDMVREVFGGDIDLDPASCEQANTLIGAKKFYSSDGLDRPWSGNVYLNPPGGQILREGRKHNQAALWYATLAHRFELGLVTQAVFTIFNLELFRYAQRWAVRQPLGFPVCFPVDRIDFFKPGPDGVPVPQGSPAHPNAVIYMGSNEKRFAEVFERWGTVTSSLLLVRPSDAVAVPQVAGSVTFSAATTMSELPASDCPPRSRTKATVEIDEIDNDSRVQIFEGLDMIRSGVLALRSILLRRTSPS